VRCGQGGVAVPRYNIDDLLACTDIGGLGQQFADNLQRDADDGEVAARPCRLLALFNRGKIRSRRRRGMVRPTHGSFLLENAV
jgi:hypothetical protein